VFWVLWHLVGGEIDADGLREATRIDFSRMIRDTNVEVKREKKVEREKPPQRTSTPRMNFENQIDIQNPITEVVPLIDTRGAMSRMSMGAGSDRDVLPLVRVPPEYPPRALSRGLEGWVLVQFTITPQGMVRDPVVIDSMPKDVFDDAALKAISRWRYNAKIDGGVPVERVGVQTRIVFELEE
jgi:protein TonB